jgi:hypothetical protein
MKAMAVIGIIFFGLILIKELYELGIVILCESRLTYGQIYHLKNDLIMTLPIVIYAFSFSLVVFIKTRKK